MLMKTRSTKRRWQTYSENLIFTPARTSSSRKHLNASGSGPWSAAWHGGTNSWSRLNANGRRVRKVTDLPMASTEREMTKKAKKKPHTSELKLRQNRGSWAKNDPNLLRVGGGTGGSDHRGGRIVGEEGRRESQ